MTEKIKPRYVPHKTLEIKYTIIHPKTAIIRIWEMHSLFIAGPCNLALIPQMVKIQIEIKQNNESKIRVIMLI